MEYTKEMINKCVSDNKLDTVKKTSIMCKCDGEAIFVAYYEDVCDVEAIFVAYYEDVFKSCKHSRKLTTEAIKLLIQVARTSKRMKW